MSEEKIILSYNNIKKEIKVPETFPDLEEIFTKEFNEKITNNFRFYYLDEDQDQIDIDNDSNYSEGLNEIKNQNNPTIFIEKIDEKDNNNNNFGLGINMKIEEQHIERDNDEDKDEDENDNKEEELGNSENLEDNKNENAGVEERDQMKSGHTF